MIRNSHQRLVHASPEACWALLERLGTAQDRLWPHHRWSPIHIEGPLVPGTPGGHGPLRYQVEAVEPGRLLRFRFSCPHGATGTHGFTIEPVDAHRSILRHDLEMVTTPASLLSWWGGLRLLHDALMEDTLDCAQRALEPWTTLPERPLPLHIRGLRRFGSKRLKAFRPLGITPQELEAELFMPELR